MREDFAVIVGNFWIALALVVVLLVLSSCANIKEWRHTVTEDKVNNIKTTEIYYKMDSGFDLGTEGLGEYYLIKVEGF